MSTLKGLVDPKVRQYLYRVAIAGCGVLAVKGVLTKDVIDVITPFLAALFAVADANVETNQEG